MPRKTKATETEQTATLDAPVLDEAGRVLTWRLAQFERLGFDYVGSVNLANSKVDWHDAAELLASGCSHELAEKILL